MVSGLHGAPYVMKHAEKLVCQIVGELKRGRYSNYKAQDEIRTTLSSTFPFHLITVLNFICFNNTFCLDPF